MPCSLLGGGGVRRIPLTRSGSWGTGIGGSSGEASPSAVETVDKAGDPGEGEMESRGSRKPSCAKARGGCCRGDLGENVFTGSFDEEHGQPRVSEAVCEERHFGGEGGGKKKLKEG